MGRTRNREEEEEEEKKEPIASSCDQAGRKPFLPVNYNNNVH